MCYINLCFTYLLTLLLEQVEEENEVELADPH